MVTSWQLHPMAGKMYIILHGDAYDNVDFIGHLEGPFENEYTARLWVASQARYHANQYVETPVETEEKPW